jgi:hypothetical protein
MKHVFFSIGSWEFLLLTTWKQGWLQNGDALMFNSIKTLVLFSSVWYACVMVGHRMMVWLTVLLGDVRSAKILQNNGRRICVEKISSACFF